MLYYRRSRCGHRWAASPAGWVQCAASGGPGRQSSAAAAGDPV